MKIKFLLLTAIRLLIGSGFILSLCCISFSQEYTTDSNTVALYHFNEISGSAVYDSSGNSYNGTVTGTTIVNGKYGKARSFDGLNDYVRIPNTSALNLPGSCTVEAWIYPTRDAHATVACKWGDRLGWWEQRAWNLAVRYDRKVEFSISDFTHQYDTSFHIFRTPANAISLNQWNHIAGVYDQMTGTRRIYVNGVKVAERIDEPITILNSIADVAVGVELYSPYSFDHFFPGFIDEVRISNKVREPWEFNIPPPFTDINAGIIGVIEGTTAWGDYDNDGDLDLLVVGRTENNVIVAKVYRNDQGTFIDINAGLQGAIDAHPASWVDYDNDGDLDIFLSGATIMHYGFPVTKIYRNDGGVFIDAQVNLPALTGTLHCWGDYDNDGDVDLFLAGSPDSGSTFVSKIFRNDGSGNFVDINAGIQGVWAGNAAWGDYDNDGDLDLVISGYDGSGVICNLYRNNGGNFVKVENSFSDLLAGALCWGDYDNDGDLDLLSTGFAPHWVPMTMIYRNDGNGFTMTTPLEHFGFSVTAWGDYDADGDLDIVIGGKLRSGNYLSTVYRNDNGNFVDINASLPLGMFNNTAWGDYDNDGDLDLVISGATVPDPGNPGQYYTFTKILRNNSNSNSFTTNTIPNAPTNLSKSIIGNKVILSWNNSTDNQTPQEGIGYNLRIGKSPNGEEVCSPMANLATGKRLLVQMGNTNQQNSWCIKNLPHDTYYWSVQAVDGAFAGSNFAVEDSFVIKSTISGMKFNDLNKNGIRDNNESGIPNWKIRINGARTDSTFTDSNGNYVFENLEIGTYYISENDSSDWERTYPSPNDRYTIIITDSISSYDSLDFGNHQIPPRVKIKLTVHDNSIVSERNLYFGVESGATFGIWGVSQQATSIDSIEDEYELPPVMEGTFDARFINPRGGTSLFGRGSWTDIRDFTSHTQQDTHLVSFQPGAGGYPMTFKWSKEEIIKKYGGTVKLGKNPGNWVDMKTNDSLVLTNTNTKELFIITEKPMIPILYEPGWNLVSLPVKVVDGRKEILFPDANSHAFIYNPIIGYDEKDTLVPGVGYWLKFPTILLPFTIDGIPRTEDTIDVTAGWNLIGTLSETITTNTVGSIPPNIITSDFFGYENTYYFTDSLEPMKAYWVKVNEDGKLILSTSSYITASNRIKIISTLELPPLPPDQASTSRSQYIPENFSITQNYPNPFNPSTKIKYELKKDIEVILNIYDVLGRNIATLVNDKQQAGQHEVTWNAEGFSSGIYYYRLVVGDFIETKKMILMK